MTRACGAVTPRHLSQSATGFGGDPTNIIFRCMIIIVVGKINTILYIIVLKKIIRNTLFF